VLNLAAQATKSALTWLLPVLPERAAQGLRQLGAAPESVTLSLSPQLLAPGHRVGQGFPLFPRVEAGNK
jgi:methionyl-tRNA synthetase